MNIQWFCRSIFSGLGLLFIAGCQPQPAAISEKNDTVTVINYHLVSTEQGAVQGVVADGLVNFKGLPFAAPPIGELRWRAPQPALERTAVLQADSYANRCYQRPQNPQWGKPEAFTQPESEDCLYMNIIRPDTAEKDLPVMVWIHGGGLIGGSGSRPVNYGGNLASKNVVFVAFNYRLGSFGFFAHPQLSAANPDNGRLFNYGLMDQLAALEWIQKNIQQFGGNPDNVTIFGESAGGYAVDMLVASQAKTALFTKAISQSGYGRDDQPRVAALITAEQPPIEAMGTALATALGKPEASLAELRQVSAEDIVKATDFTSFISFAVDGVVIKEDLTHSFAKGTHAPIPMMLGATDFEFGMVPPDAQRGIMSGILSGDAMAELIPYYGSELLRDTMLYSDYVFHAQARQLALANEHVGQPTYVYRFGMPVQMMQNLETPDGLVYGAPHAGELPYMFGNFTGDHMESTTPSERELAVSEQMMTYWTNFAKYSNPNGDSTTLPQWPAYDGRNSSMIMRFTPENTAAQSDSWHKRLDKLNSYLSD